MYERTEVTTANQYTLSIPVETAMDSMTITSKDKLFSACTTDAVVLMCPFIFI